MIDFGSLIAISGIVFILLIQLFLVRLLSRVSFQVKELMQKGVEDANIKDMKQGISNQFLQNLGFKTDKMKKSEVHVYHVSTGKKEIVPIYE